MFLCLYVIFLFVSLTLSLIFLFTLDLSTKLYKPLLADISLHYCLFLLPSLFFNNVYSKFFDLFLLNLSLSLHQFRLGLLSTRSFHLELLPLLVIFFKKVLQELLLFLLLDLHPFIELLLLLIHHVIYFILRISHLLQVLDLLFLHLFTKGVSCSTVEVTCKLYFRLLVYNQICQVQNYPGRRRKGSRGRTSLELTLNAG